MASIEFGKNNVVVLRLRRNCPSEWNSEAKEFIRENYRDFFDLLDVTIYPFTKISCEGKDSTDYLEGADTSVVYDRLCSDTHYVYEHYVTGEVWDTSVPGCKALSYHERVDSIGACSPAKPWFCKAIKRVVFTKSVKEKVPFFLSPKRTRFYDLSIVAEEDQLRGPTNPAHRCHDSIPETIIDAVDEVLFARLDTKEGGKEFERLARFKITI